MSTNDDTTSPKNATHHSKLIFVQLSVFVDVTQIPNLRVKSKRVQLPCGGLQADPGRVYERASHLSQDVERKVGVDENRFDLVS